MRILTYTAQSSGIMVKQILKSELRLASSVVTALKNSGGITVNQEQVTVRRVMEKGDVLKLYIPQDKSSCIVPVKADIHVLYEDEDILCVNKLRGMPTHPSQNHYTDTLANAVCYYYRDIPFTFRVSNRLDSYTSGVVIIAKNMYSASYFCENSFRQTVQKTYYALCRGIFAEKSGTVVAPIDRCEGSTIKREVSPRGKYAETAYEVLKEGEGVSLVRLMPKTGRTHQIRVHMAHIGHPLFNDFLYDELCDENEKFCLHCGSLSFMHPTKDSFVEINAPVPDYFNLV